MEKNTKKIATAGAIVGAVAGVAYYNRQAIIDYLKKVSASLKSRPNVKGNVTQNVQKDEAEILERHYIDLTEFNQSKKSR